MNENERQSALNEMRELINEEEAKLNHLLHSLTGDIRRAQFSLSVLQGLMAELDDLHSTQDNREE